MRMLFRGTPDCKVHGSDLRVGGSIALKTENDGSLRVYFVIRILPFIDWTCSAMRARECGLSHG